MLGMFGKSAGLMETPEQRAERERLAMMFGNRPVPDGNSFGIDPATLSAIGQAAVMPVEAAPERWIDGGKFSGKDALGLALGAIGDAFSRNAGGEATTAPMLFQGMADSRKAKEAAARAQAERADWVWKQQYQAQNRPVEEDAFTKSMRAAGIDPASPQARALYQQRVQTMASPAPNFLGDGLGGGRWVTPPSIPLPGPQVQGAPQGGSPQPGAIEDGYQFMGGNPGDPKSWKPVGGGVGNGAGGFPSNRIPSGNPLQRPW